MIDTTQNRFKFECTMLHSDTLGVSAGITNDLESYDCINLVSQEEGDVRDTQQRVVIKLSLDSADELAQCLTLLVQRLRHDDSRPS